MRACRAMAVGMTVAVRVTMGVVMTVGASGNPAPKRLTVIYVIL
jgi:hypothetical protein